MGVEEIISDMSRLEAENRELRRQLRFANERNHERNVQLDALHFVWCDGGCYFGVHRFGDCDRPLTEETVLAAERNTARLRKWWNSARFRAEAGQSHAHEKGHDRGGPVSDTTGRALVYPWDEWTEEEGVKCVVCPCCAFTFDATHTEPEGHYSCANCEAVSLDQQVRFYRDALEAIVRDDELWRMNEQAFAIHTARRMFDQARYALDNPPPPSPVSPNPEGREE